MNRTYTHFTIFLMILLFMISGCGRLIGKTEQPLSAEGTSTASEHLLETEEASQSLQPKPAFCQLLYSISPPVAMSQ